MKNIIPMACEIHILFRSGNGHRHSCYNCETDDMATAQQFADRYIKGKWPKVERVESTDRADGGEKEEAK